MATGNARRPVASMAAAVARVVADHGDLLPVAHRARSHPAVALVDGAGGDGDVIACVRQGQRGGTADTAARAGHEGDRGLSGHGRGG